MTHLENHRKNIEQKDAMMKLFSQPFIEFVYVSRDWCDNDVYWILVDKYTDVYKVSSLLNSYKQTESITPLGVLKFFDHLVNTEKKKILYCKNENRVDYAEKLIEKMITQTSSRPTKKRLKNVLLKIKETM